MGGWKGKNWIDELNSPTHEIWLRGGPVKRPKIVDSSWNELFEKSK